MVVWFDRTLLQSALVFALDSLHSSVPHKTEPAAAVAVRRRAVVAKRGPHVVRVDVPAAAAGHAVQAFFV